METIIIIIAIFSTVISFLHWSKVRPNYQDYINEKSLPYVDKKVYYRISNITILIFTMANIITFFYLIYLLLK